VTWPHFRFGQRDLAKLCRVSSLHESEYHPENILYGFDCLLRSYASLPDHEPLPWAMEHAIRFDDPRPVERDMQTRLPIILAVTEAQAEILRRRNPARAVPVGSAFFYMKALYDDRFGDWPALERRGTLVFPDKSIVGQDVDYDRRRFAQKLAELPSEFQPVAVSIFWKDYLRGTHRAFEEAGLMTVTSGYFCDPLFLFRQYDLCRQFKYALANDISSSFCFSVLSGCRFIYLPTGALQVRKQGVVTSYDEEPTLALPAKQNCMSASPFPPAPDNRRQRELAALYSGEKDVRSPEFFRELFAEGRRLLRSRAAVHAQFGPQSRMDELATWLPSGVDPGGWTYDRFGFEAPESLGASALRLHLQIPFRAMRGRTDVILVKIGEGREHELHVRPGFWTLDIPASGGDAVVVRWPGRGNVSPIFRGMRLFQIAGLADNLASPSWRKWSFRSWSRGIENRKALSVLKQILVSWGGDLSRMLRGTDLPPPRRIAAQARPIQ
jgi:hypothetical protein